MSVMKGDDIFNVEYIFGRRYSHGKPLYRVKWEGYPRSKSTWEPIENLMECGEHIAQFETELSRRKRKSVTIDRYPRKKKQVTPDREVRADLFCCPVVAWLQSHGSISMLTFSLLVSWLDGPSNFGEKGLCFRFYDHLLCSVTVALLLETITHERVRRMTVT